MARRRPATDDDPLTRVHGQLTAAVEALVQSDAWRRMLDVASRFPRYSPNNVLLICVQRPDATAVAGLRTWNSLGRRVRKGEKGIAILAPCTYRQDPGPGNEPAHEPATPLDGTPDRPRVLRGFRVAHVFDITQTEGAPLPDVAPAQLIGTSPAELWQRLQQLAEGDGYRVERGPCGVAYGLTSFTDRVVRVRDDVDPAQACKTLAHEIGHLRADHQARFAEDYHRSPACRGAAEVEAESIAYIVAAAAGLDTSGYTVPYVAHWAAGDTSLLRDTASLVLATARQILTDTGTAAADPTAHQAARWCSPAGVAPALTSELTRGPSR
jgi:antirestriction protein ArdC